MFGDADDISSDEEDKAKKATEKPMRTGLEDDEDGDEFETGDRITDTVRFVYSTLFAR